MSRARTALTAALALTAAAAVAVPAAASTKVTSSTTAALAEAEVTESPTVTSTVSPTGTLTTAPTSTSRTPCPTYSAPMQLWPGATPATQTFEARAGSGVWTQAGSEVPTSAAAARSGSAGLSVADLAAAPVTGVVGTTWRATGSFRVKVFARLAPGTPDTTVQLRILNDAGVQVGKIKKTLRATAWTPLSKDVLPGYTVRELTCNGRVTDTWNLTGPLTLELSPAQKAVVGPLGLLLDDGSLTYLGDRPVKTTTTKITTPKPSTTKTTKPKSTKTRTKSTKTTSPKTTSIKPTSTATMTP